MFGAKRLVQKVKKEKTFFDFLLEKAKNMAASKTIVLPEGEEDRVISAVEKAAAHNIAKIVLLGKEIVIMQKISKKALKSVTIIDNTKLSRTREYYAEELYNLRKHKGIDKKEASKMLDDPIIYGIMMVQMGDADGMVAGCTTMSANVMRPAFQIIKTHKDIEKASSCFIVEMPEGSKYGENGVLVFADCSVIPFPTSNELVDIAIASAKTARDICGIKVPKIAFLSYATKTVENEKTPPEIMRIKNAYKLLRRKDSSLVADGELQADAALEPFVANIKSPRSLVAGHANVLVFPDINSGNIAYKLVQYISGVRAIGPILQGLNKPINDLSRGATSDEIFITIALTALQAQ